MNGIIERATYAIAALAFFLAAAPCVAAETAPELDQLADLSLEELLEVRVTIASKYRQRSADAPASVTVLTAKEFKTYGWRTLAEALRSVRGFFIPYDRAYSYTGVRGFQPVGDYNSKVLLLVDGYRTNDNVYDQAEIGQEFVLDVDLIERVEIIRGPSSSVYGGNALFAVINVITKSADSLKGIELTAAAGSYGLLETRASLGKTAPGGLGIVMSASRYTSDGPTLSFPGEPSTGGAPIADTDWEDNSKFFAKFDSDGMRLSIAHSERKKGLTGGVILDAPVDPRNMIEDRHTFVDFEIIRALGAVEWSARLAYSEYDYTALAYFTPTNPNQDIGRGNWWNTEIKGVTSARSHHFVFGLEYQANTNQDQSNYDLAPYSLFLDDRRSSERTGLFVQDDYQATDRLTISAGLRYDTYSHGDGQVNPRLGVIYRLTDRSVGKFVYGTAFRPPSAYEAHYEFPGLQAASTLLVPEEISTYEAIVETTPAANLQVKGALFEYRVSNLIASGIDPISGLDQFQNLNKATARGAEAEIQYAWSGGSRVRASVSLTETEDESGERLQNSPRTIATVNGTLPLLRGWRAGIEGQFVSRRKSIASDIPSYFVSNLTVSTDRPLQGWELSASVYNVFDRSYFQSAFINSTRDRMEQDGRTFRFKALYRF